MNKLAGWMSAYIITLRLYVQALLAVVLVLCHVTMLHAARYAAESSITSNFGYNDNVYLQDNNKKTTTYITLSPKMDLSVEDMNWKANLGLRAQANKYADNALSDIEQHYDASVVSQDERNIYVINGGYDVISNLNTESSDFGLVRTQVDRTTLTLSPRYEYAITQRFSLSLAYALADVEFDNTVNTGFVPYRTKTPSIALRYNTSERGQLSFVTAVTDYKRDDGLSGYNTKVYQMAYGYQFAENLSGQFSVGRNKRDVTTQTTTVPILFLGAEIAQLVDVDSTSSGSVYNAELTHKVYNGVFSYRISKDAQASSFGSLDEVSAINVNADRQVTDLWGYNLSASYTETTNLGAGSISTSRKTAILKAALRYSIKRNLKIHGSYQYLTREFDALTNNSKPDSNRIYLGLTYSFKDIASY